MPLKSSLELRLVLLSAIFLIKTLDILSFEPNVQEKKVYVVGPEGIE